MAVCHYIIVREIWMHEVSYVHYIGREGFVCLFWLDTLAWESDKQSRAHLLSAIGLFLQYSTISLGTMLKGLDISLTGFGADVYLLCNSFCPQVMPGHPQEIKNRNLRCASLICATPLLTADMLSCATIHSTEQGGTNSFWAWEVSFA